MCGIAGLVGEIAKPDLVARMTGLMRHRGPDGEGLWCDPAAQFALGHRRLSIIDLATGDQPMTSPDERYVISYNGEIYNYIELRPDLERRGWTFRTTSDTEVLLAGLILEGPEFLQKTNGMFALALWDARDRRLLLARDRVGVKPLYYCEPQSGSLAFASDLRALLEVPGIEATLNPDAVNAYLALRYVPAPWTMLKQVRKFPAGHWATFQNGRLEFTRYWQVTFESGSASGWSQHQAAEELESILADAVRLRLRSDVPYGVFLSGGIDSSVVTALTSRIAGTPVLTYSIGFSEGADERTDARRVAEQLGTRHHELELFPSDLRRLGEVAWQVDEPFPDPIVLAMTTLAQRASRDVKVILTGEGADELFGGYVHHPHLLLLSRLAGIMPAAALPLASAAARHTPLFLLDGLFNYPASAGPLLRERLAGLIGCAKDETERYLAYVSLFTKDERRHLLAPQFSSDVLERFVAERLVQLPGQWIDRMWTFEHRYWLADNILFKQDKTLMAHSVEGREPFCDYRLVEFAARLPVKARLHGGINKVLLRAAAKRIVPDLPAPTRKKQAFMVPLSGAYGTVIREIAGDVLCSSRFRSLGIFNEAQVDTLLAKFPNASFLVSRQVMALLMFGLWHQALTQRAHVAI